MKPFSIGDAQKEFESLFSAVMSCVTSHAPTGEPVVIITMGGLVDEADYRHPFCSDPNIAAAAWLNEAFAYAKQIGEQTNKKLKDLTLWWRIAPELGEATAYWEKGGSLLGGGHFVFEPLKVYKVYSRLLVTDKAAL